MALIPASEKILAVYDIVFTLNILRSRVKNEDEMYQLKIGSVSIRFLVKQPCFCNNSGGEGEVAFFSAKRWDRRRREDLIESATPCHDAQMVGLYLGSNPVRTTVLAAKSEDYTTAPQHLLILILIIFNYADDAQDHRVIPKIIH